jgi:hypothetical protein
MTQIPPEKYHLSQFDWFDYVRPLDKDDIFVWRGKKGGTELKKIKRKEAPLQSLKPKEQEEPKQEDTENNE